VKNPVPRARPRAAPCSFKTKKTYALAPPKDLPEVSFVDVLESRRTIVPRKALRYDQLSSLLWLSARTRRAWVDQYGVRRQHRASASAGALHPVELLLLDGKNVLRYDALTHALQSVHVASPTRLTSVRDEVASIVGKRLPMVAVLVGHECVTKSVYTNSESLLWRDAGALIATLQLCSTAFNFTLMPLGVLGNAMRAALGMRCVVPAGVLLLGAK
jgi:hypothetical protein